MAAGLTLDGKQSESSLVKSCSHSGRSACTLPDLGVDENGLTQIGETPSLSSSV